MRDFRILIPPGFDASSANLVKEKVWGDSGLIVAGLPPIWLHTCCLLNKMNILTQHVMHLAWLYTFLWDRRLSSAITNNTSDLSWDIQERFVLEPFKKKMICIHFKGIKNVIISTSDKKRVIQRFNRKNFDATWYNGLKCWVHKQ